MSPPQIAAVVLAAGSSSRMGRPKQLIEFEGQTLIRRTVQTVSSSLVAGIVVTTAGNGVDFETELRGLQWTRVQVDNPQFGQSESVRAGLREVEAQGVFDAILFIPCDLPLLSTSHLDELVRIYESGSWNIVASRYDGALGAPLIVRNTLWPTIYDLRGDVGVRKILSTHSHTTAAVEWEDGKFDLDTPADLSTLLHKRG